MASITTEPATITHWDDVQHSLSGGGDGRSCQCVWPIVRNKDWQASTLEQRREIFHDEIQAGPPPGLLAYADGEVAGWVRVGPRTKQLRVLHTKAIVTATAEELDDASVWAITCFVVRKEHRGKGVTAQLLTAALDYARASGARMVEAYPIDTSTGSHHANALFHGSLTTFLTAGFTQGEPLTGGRVLVTRPLDN